MCSGTSISPRLINGGMDDGFDPPAYADEPGCCCPETVRLPDALWERLADYMSRGSGKRSGYGGLVRGGRESGGMIQGGNHAALGSTIGETQLLGSTGGTLNGDGVGTWHSHPYIPAPSSKDMKSLVKRSHFWVIAKGSAKMTLVTVGVGQDCPKTLDEKSFCKTQLPTYSGSIKGWAKKFKSWDDTARKRRIKGCPGFCFYSGDALGRSVNRKKQSYKLPPKALRITPKVGTSAICGSGK